MTTLNDQRRLAGLPAIGRPPRDGEAANEQIKIRVTPARRARWERAAVAESRPLADWVRDSCDKRTEGK